MENTSAAKKSISPKMEPVGGQPAIRVTPDNFRRAESDMYFTTMAVTEDGFGKFRHRRELFSVDKQIVVRGNRDTIYSSGVFDLDAGPVTITLPDAGKRFMSMMVLNEDQYAIAVYYSAGSYTITREEAGTRYAAIALRTLVDPLDTSDMDKVIALQDAVKVEQRNKGSFEVPDWDKASQKKVRDALLMLQETLTDFKNAFGPKDKVDPVKHLIGTAAGWGGNPDKDASYLGVTPEKNDGKTIYRLTVKDVPVDAFWSVSVYNKEGYFEKNEKAVYSLNNLTAKKDADGSISIQFGGCDDNSVNCIPIMPGWNYTVRLYRPRPEILNGIWKFPEAVPVK